MKFTNNFYEDQISESTRDFLEGSKLFYHDVAQYAIHVNNIMNNPYYMNEIINHSVELGNVDAVKLPEVDYSKNNSLNTFYSINKDRKSIRTYLDTAINIEELSTFLRTSLFISRKRSESDIGLMQKNIASPGGLYPVELYYINLKDDFLDIGTYFYDEENSELKSVYKINSDNFINEVYRAFAVDEKMDIDIKSASGIIVLGATLNRLSFKYLDRGIRWAFTEAGAITHNIQLAATAMENIGVCPCAGFFDDFVSELIGYKTIDQVPIVSLIVGKIK